MKSAAALRGRGLDTAVSRGSDAATRWSLRLFGEFELRELPGGQKVTVPGKRERVLLAYLAVSPDCRESRRKLTMLLWGDSSDETSLDNLRTCVFNLRKALGDTEHRLISSDGRDIVLNATAFKIDVLALRAVAPHSGPSELEEAANLYRGEFLDGLGIESEEFESWRREEVARCKDRALDILTWLMRELAEAGEIARAIEAGLRVLRLDPLHEAATRRLMQLYAETGRRGAAIELYRSLADALKTELNAQPDGETRALFVEIARGSEERMASAATNGNSPRLSAETPVADAGQPPTHANAAIRNYRAPRRFAAIAAGVAVLMI